MRARALFSAEGGIPWSSIACYLRISYVGLVRCAQYCFSYEYLKSLFAIVLSLLRLIVYFGMSQ